MKHSDKDVDNLRLQVFLSHSGVCSRRRALELILEGHVSVNGLIVLEPSTKIDPSKDRVVFKNKEIRLKEYEYLLLNKPQGYVTTLEDPHAKRTVMDLLPATLKHLKPVGRLDKDTEGLLLLTNDGDLAYRLTHPKFNIEKTYFVEVRGKLKSSDRRRLEEGIMLEGKKTSPAKITALKCEEGKSVFLLSIHEGRKRQIRLMMRTVGYPVSYLKREVLGSLRIGALKAGRWRFLKKKEIEQLKGA